MAALGAAVLVALVVACGGDDDGAGGDGNGAGETTAPAATGPISFTSEAFSSGGAIPVEHSCDGDNISPPLSWSGVPEGAAALVLTMDDPDANRFVHWLVYDIPPETIGFTAGVPPNPERVDGSRQGTNSRGEIGYTGPCPPSGEHDYVFRLYALDEQTGLEAGASLAEVEAAVEGHVLALSELVGTFSR